MRSCVDCTNPYNDTGLSSVEVYDPAADTWWKVGNVKARRKSLASAAVEGRTYVIGGIPVAGWDPALATVEECDLSPAVSSVRPGNLLRVYWNEVLQTTDWLGDPVWEDASPRAYPWLVNPVSGGSVKFFRAREP